MLPASTLLDAWALSVVGIDNPLESYPSRDWEKVYRELFKPDSSFTFLCAPNDTHNCLLRAYVKNGVVVRIEPTYGYNKARDLYGNHASVSDLSSSGPGSAVIANGNLKTQTDVKGNTIAFTYDPLNRVVLKDYPTGTDVTYKYDKYDDGTTTNVIGRLTKMTDASGQTLYYYDFLGPPTRVAKTVDGTTYDTSTAYDPVSGRLDNITYRDGEKVKNEYNAGLLSKVTDLTTSKPVVSYAGFNALGQPKTVTYGNGVTTTYDYHAQNNRLVNALTKNSAGNIMNLTYGYYDAGNIKTINDAINPSQSQFFVNDQVNRLIQAQSTAYGPMFYAYDQIGNILNKEGMGYDYAATACTTGKPHAVKATTDGKSYCYDENGNMVSELNSIMGFSRTIAYDYDNMPSSVTLNGVTTSFVYDGAGARVMKSNGTVTTVYIGKLYECKGSACSKYIIAGGTRVALKASATDVLYYHRGRTTSRWRRT